MANDQPSPSRNSPAKICHELPSGAQAHSSSDTSSVPPPVASTTGRPARSANIPTSGENANIPSTCAESTTPMISSPDPPCSMCSGVITMTLTIVAWAPARPSTA